MPIVVVAGALAGKWMNGGEAWVRLSWARGFEQLGFEVYLVEQIAEAQCVGASEEPVPFALSANRDYFRRVMNEFGMESRSSLLCLPGRQTEGLGMADLEEIAEEAKVLLNISGHLEFEPLLNRFRRRVYLDVDPGYTQYWHAQGLLGTTLERHHSHFTIGENIGKPWCPIPTDGIRWQPTRQPVVIPDWPMCPSPSGKRFTTVGSLRGPYGRVQDGGTSYGLKVHEMRKLAPLPSQVELILEVAMHIDSGDEPDQRMLQAYGWRVVDPREVAPGPARFRSYVQGSDAEFSVAQGIYVETASGWFSDRTARYLASGKPAIVQDTGLAPNLPVGKGLVTFRTLPEAAAALERVAEDYRLHSQAARKLAEDHLEATRVVGALAERLGVGP